MIAFLLEALLQVLIRSQLPPLPVDHLQRKIPQNPKQLHIRVLRTDEVSLATDHA